MRRFIFLLLRLTGLPFLIRTIFQRHAVTILCYHDLKPDVAERHIELLRKRYRFISLRSYIDWRLAKSNSPPPPYAIIMTLDDGYRGNTRLQSTLERTGTPATVFLCSAIVDSNRHYWWSKIHDPVELEEMKRLPDADRLARLAREGHDEMREYPDRQAISREEIERMKQIVDFQSHTRLHPVLPTCSEERARDEIAEAKTELEKQFGLSIYALAYPNGDYSERETEIARESGYRCALTLDGGYNTSETDLYRLKRIRVDDDSGASELIVKVSGLWDLIQGALGRRHYGFWNQRRIMDAFGTVMREVSNDKRHSI